MSDSYEAARALDATFSMWFFLKVIVPTLIGVFAALLYNHFTQ